MTNSADRAAHPAASGIGLAIALFGLPVVVSGFRLITGESHSNLQVLSRELVIFALLGLMLWLVTAWERLPLKSIGLNVNRLGRSILWGLLLAVISFATTVCLYLLLKHFGVDLGGSDKNVFHPSLWVVTFMMVRAGVVEEAFYRGYAIERLQSLTGSRWVAGLAPLIVFAAFHYRQGPGGVIAVFILGAVMTLFYMKRRDLVANMTGHFLVDFIFNVILR